MSELELTDEIFSNNDTELENMYTFDNFDMKTEIQCSTQTSSTTNHVLQNSAEMDFLEMPICSNKMWNELHEIKQQGNNNSSILDGGIDHPQSKNLNEVDQLDAMMAGDWNQKEIDEEETEFFDQLNQDASHASKSNIDEENKETIKIITTYNQEEEGASFTSNSKYCLRFALTPGTNDRQCDQHVICGDYSIQRRDWAAALLASKNVVKCAEIIFKALFTLDMMKNCTLSGLDRNRNSCRVMEPLCIKRMHAVYVIVGWMQIVQNQTKDKPSAFMHKIIKNPYEFEIQQDIANLNFMTQIESSCNSAMSMHCYCNGLNPQMKAEIRQKIFIDLRNQLANGHMMY